MTKSLNAMRAGARLSLLYLPATRLRGPRYQVIDGAVSGSCLSG